jgi:hypothetical protein
VKKHPWSAVIVAVVIAGEASAQVKLEWQFREGEVLLVERVATRKQAVTVKGTVRAEERRNTSVLAVRFKAKTADAFVLDVKYESIKFAVTPVGGAKTPIEDAAPAVRLGSNLTVTITPQGKLLKLDGFDAFIAKLAGKDSAHEKMLKAMLSEDAVRADLEDVFSFLPERPVAKGAQWKHVATEPVPPFGSFKAALDYMLTEQQGDECTLACAIKLAYRPPSGDGDFLRVLKGGLTKSEGKGTILFDAKKGRPIRSEKDIHLRGELVVESFGKRTPLDFTIDSTWRMRTFTRDSRGSGLNK